MNNLLSDKSDHCTIIGSPSISAQFPRFGPFVESDAYAQIHTYSITVREKIVKETNNE
jgi:hypothetical protein